MNSTALIALCLNDATDFLMPAPRNLKPASKPSTIARRAAAIRRIQELGRRVTPGGLKIRDMISEGRK